MSETTWGGPRSKRREDRFVAPEDGYYWYFPDPLDSGDWHNDSQEPMIVWASGECVAMMGYDVTCITNDAFGRFVGPIKPP
jgi:hypothetical protein